MGGWHLTQDGLEDDQTERSHRFRCETKCPSGHMIPTSGDHQISVLAEPFHASEFAAFDYMLEDRLAHVVAYRAYLVLAGADFEPLHEIRSVGVLAGSFVPGGRHGGVLNIADIEFFVHQQTCGQGWAGEFAKLEFDLLVFQELQ